MMRIGLDVRPALVQPTGVGSYVQALSSRMPSAAPRDEFVFFSASLRDRYPAQGWPGNVKLVDRRIPVRLLNLAWHRLGWPPLDTLVGQPLDLVHSPHPLQIPARRALSVVTIHDLFFLKHPEQVSAEIRRDYVPLVRRHARRAHGVICVSRYTAGEAQRLLELPSEKIAVIPNGIDPVYRTPVAAQTAKELLRRRGLPTGALLYVGSAEPRKNLSGLRAALAALQTRRRDPPPLVLVGPGLAEAWGDSPYPATAPGYMGSDDLRALMASARLLVMPSLEEGFGLPVAQAMAAGLPVVCSGGSALEEIAGDAACLVEPSDPAAIAAGMEKVLEQESYASRLREAGLERSQRFDWDRAAAATLDFYRRLLREHRP